MDGSVLELMTSAKKFRKAFLEDTSKDVSEWKLSDPSVSALSEVFDRAIGSMQADAARSDIPCPGLDEAEEAVSVMNFILFARSLTLKQALFMEEANERMEEILRILDCYGRGAECSRLDVVDASQTDTFLQDYVLTSRAAVLRNFDCEAWQKWSTDWFREQFGHERFPLLDLDSKDSYTVELPLSEMYDKPNRYYFANSQRLFDSNASLSLDLGLSRLTQQFITGPDGKMPMYHFSDQFFVSTGPKAKTPLHHGKIGNFFYNIQGQKQWTMIHPEFSVLLYPYLRPFDGTSAIRTIDRETMESVPLIQYVPYYEVVLEPGDILWTPYYWWHAVASLSQQNLAVSTRWFGLPGRDFQDTSPLISLATLCNQEFHAERQRVAKFERENPGKKYPWYDEFAHGRAHPEFGLHDRWKAWGLPAGVS